MKRERPEPEKLEIWPECVSVIRVFRAMFTQVSVGAAGGVIGLRYEALPVVLRLTGIPRAEQADVFEGLRIMETEALEIWNA